MQIHVLNCLVDNYVYVIRMDNEAIVIDPAQAKPVLAFLKHMNLNLLAILNTHHHQDHVGGNREIKAATGCAVFGSDKEHVPGLDRLVKDQEILFPDKFQIRVISTPGHTLSSVCYFVETGNSPALFTGDTLFTGGCGRLFEGSAKMMWESLLKIRSLGNETLVYCGHDYAEDNYRFGRSIDGSNMLLKTLSRKHSFPTTLEIECKTNVFFQSDKPKIKEFLGMDNAPDDLVFAELRRRKDDF